MRSALAPSLIWERSAPAGLTNADCSSELIIRFILGANSTSRFWSWSLTGRPIEASKRLVSWFSWVFSILSGLSLEESLLSLTALKSASFFYLFRSTLIFPLLVLLFFIVVLLLERGRGEQSTEQKNQSFSSHSRDATRFRCGS